MPLIKREPGPATPPEADAPGPAELNSPDPVHRREAARAIGLRKGPVGPLAEALTAEGDPTVREAILTALTLIGGDETVRALSACLRSEDAGLRNGAVDILRTLPEAVLPHLPGLLEDEDTDVRILAAELARSLPAERGSDLLCRMLEREADPNACAAALDVLAEIGTRAVLPTLRRVADRFAGEPFLPFAVSVVIARIEGSGD